jgi:bacteriocin biosynthesis cyclodehydratase domain-containing protein
MRIHLKPGLALVRRGPTSAQIGLEERHGLVLDGLTDADLGLLDQLTAGVDETRPPPGARVEAADAQARRLRRAQLIDLLTETGVLVRARSPRSALGALGHRRPRLTPDAAAWSLVHRGPTDGWDLLAARTAAVVEIDGAGRLGLTLAGTLAAAGVGTVRVRANGRITSADVCPAGARPDDVGLPTRDAARRAVARGRADPLPTGPRPADDQVDDPANDSADDSAEGSAEDERRPDLVVLIDRLAADSTRADRLLAADVPHLSVLVRETTVLVGPLVRPGQGACLRCLDLHRSDRDRQWPIVLAQLLSAATAGRAPREETSIAQLAASLAALQVLGQLDGRSVPASVGATLEVELPDGLIARRPWPTHPSCGCSGLPDTPPGPTRPPDRAPGGRGEPATSRMAR